MREAADDHAADGHRVERQPVDGQDQPQGTDSRITQLLNGRDEVLRGDREPGSAAAPDGDRLAPTAQDDPEPGARLAEGDDHSSTLLDGTGELREGPQPRDGAREGFTAAEAPPLRMSPLERQHPLPTIRPEDGTRDADGRLESVHGQPVDDFLRDLAVDRHDRYVEGRGTPDLAKSQVGPVFSLVLDRRTGDIYEGTNTMAPNRLPSDLHPVLQERVDRLTERAEADPQGYEYPGGDRGPFPHFSVPGTHAEVQAVDRALRHREALGMSVDASHLNELTVQSRFLEGPKRGGDAACCPNCTTLLDGVDSLAGFREADEMKR